MNCRVVVEAAVPVYDVGTADEAVRIAISKTGEMLNPDLNYVEISMAERTCDHCGEPHDPAFIAADESLVALELEMTVFSVERDEHAARIARKEIGQRMDNIPLEVLEITELPDEDEEQSADDRTDGGEQDAGGEQATAETGTDDTEPTESTASGRAREDEESTAGEGATEDDILPEFEDLIDE